MLSRTHPGLLIKLFEQEVPEIYEGIVEVKGAAREPGGRAKIAVYSHDRDVDPVGACVGMRGTRVQSVVQELRGEKIDIVPWTADPAEYVCRALWRRRRSRRSSWTRTSTRWRSIVPDDQLSLAIGKKGQNVRLASRLTGWRLDVRSEAEAEDEARNARDNPSAPFRASAMLPLSCSTRTDLSPPKRWRRASWKKSWTWKASAKKKPNHCTSQLKSMSKISSAKKRKRRC